VFMAPIAAAQLPPKDSSPTSSCAMTCCLRGLCSRRERVEAAKPAIQFNHYDSKDAAMPLLGPPQGRCGSK